MHLSARDMALHVTVLGWLFVVWNALMLAMAAFAFFFFGSLAVVAGDPEAAPILLTIGLLGGAFLGVLALPGLAAGFGLLTRRSWGRILAIVLAILSLVSGPVGLILGLYALFVLLFQDEATPYFAGNAAKETALARPPVESSAPVKPPEG